MENELVAKENEVQIEASAGFEAQLKRALATNSPEVMSFYANAISRVFSQEHIEPKERFEIAVDQLQSMNPRNSAEAMLCAQMLATFNMSLKMSEKALQTDRVDFADRYVNRATKMMNLYIKQVETLNKLQNGGSQKITVERVEVSDGSQAIVGNIQGGRR